jgi:hypothetical protein
LKKIGVAKKSTKENLRGQFFIFPKNPGQTLDGTGLIYSLRPKLLGTFNKSLCPKLVDLFISYPNLDFFGKSNYMDGKKHCQLA